MKTGIAKERYTILSLDEDMDVTDFDGEIEIDQFEGEEVEIWQERADGFLFAYCNRLEIGYWVIPSLIDVKGDV